MSLGRPSPFPYFCDFHGDLAEAVRKGRHDQLAKLQEAADPEALERAPDPEAESTFLSGKLHWEEAESGVHAEWLSWFQRVLRVRREAIVPLLNAMTPGCGSFEVVAPGGLICTWQTGDAQLRLEANLCGQAREGFVTAGAGDVLWLEGTTEGGGRFGPWTVRWSRLTENV